MGYGARTTRQVRWSENGTQLRSKVRLSTERGDTTRHINGKEEHLPNKFRIKYEGLEKHRAGRPECRGAYGGTIAGGHAEEFSQRVEDELGQVRDTKMSEEQRTKQHRGIELGIGKHGSSEFRRATGRCCGEEER